MNDQNKNNLDKMFKALRDQRPSELQVEHWQKAVQMELNKELKPSSQVKLREQNSKTVFFSRWQWATQLVAAVIIGVVMGITLMKMFNAPRATSENILDLSFNDATFEHSHANLD